MMINYFVITLSAVSVVSPCLGGNVYMMNKRVYMMDECVYMLSKRYVQQGSGL